MSAWPLGILIVCSIRNILTDSTPTCNAASANVCGPWTVNPLSSGPQLLL